MSRCSQPGCAEAKLIYLHLKTCKAESTSSCPTNHKGCADARKLLAHYRKCRDIRSRQASNGKSQQHTCLVCSLVARNAKGSFDRSRSTSPKAKARNTMHLIPSLKLSSDQHVRIRSHSVGNDLKFSSSLPSPRKMPPPPPRFSSASQEEKVNSTREFAPEDNAFQTTAMYRALNATPSDGFAIPAEKKLIGDRLNSSGSYFRPRAESLDIRQTRSEDQIFPGSSSVNNELKDGEEFPVPTPRRRSASCHVLSSIKSDAGFQTIQEEPVGGELQRILEGDK